MAVCGLYWNVTSEIGNIGNKNLAFGTVVAPIGQLQLAYEDSFNGPSATPIHFARAAPAARHTSQPFAEGFGGSGFQLVVAATSGSGL